MSYAIVGFGKIGQALAHAFARKNIHVTVASRRAPEALAPQAREIGPTVVAKSLQDALEADTIILAVPFGEHREIAKSLPSWKGKTIIDAMNSFPAPPEELDGLPSSAFVAKSFTGAKLVKGFNHLGAAKLATDPIVEGGHRVVFLSSDDEDAFAPVVDLAKQLGFAPVKLGKLNEGGALVHARGQTWGPLILSFRICSRRRSNPRTASAFWTNRQKFWTGEQFPSTTEKLYSLAMNAGQPPKGNYGKSWRDSMIREKRDGKLAYVREPVDTQALAKASAGGDQ